MDDQVELIAQLAGQLPTGLTDPEALNKYHKENRELDAALATGDRLAIYLEAADCAYYAIKARKNGLVNEIRLKTMLLFIAGKSGLSLPLLLDACIAKYRLRAIPGNPKNDTAEREAVAEIFRLLP